MHILDAPVPFLMEAVLKNTSTPKGSFSLGELAALLNAELKGSPELRVTGIGALDDAGPDQLSFLTDSRYEHLVANCCAAALIVAPAFSGLDRSLLISDNPYLALARAAQLFRAETSAGGSCHPSAVLGEGVLLGEGVSVGPLAHIGDNSEIGAGTVIGGGTYIGKNVRIGGGCLIHPRVSILDGCIIGERVVIHSGAVIGADGFGFAHDEKGRHIKIPQMGIVQIDDDVEIGANSTVDRATFGRTWIKRGAKIDNLVMIAHNVVVGEDSILVAQVGISGSTRLGDGVILAGQVGVAGHLEIGNGVKIGAKSGVHHSVDAGSALMGTPAVPQGDWFRMYANIQRLPRLKAELKRLEERVRQLEEALKEDDGHNSD